MLARVHGDPQRALMTNRVTSHIRSNVIGYVALFVALGGTSYAAVTLPKNSVGTKQLRNGAVTARKVRTHSLLAKDFKPGQLPAGPRGPQGAQGAPGTMGPQGARGPSDAFTQRQSAPVTIPSGNADAIVATVTLPAGSYVLDGVVQLSNVTTMPADVLCDITAGLHDASQNALAPSNSTNGGEVETAPVKTVATLQAQTPVSLECHAITGGPVSAQLGRIVAVAVGNLTGS
jgi:hypothetical protein